MAQIFPSLLTIVAEFFPGGIFPGKNFPILNSIAFGKSTSQRIYPEQRTPKIGWKIHKYGLQHALHSLDDHFSWSQYQKKKSFENFDV